MSPKLQKVLDDEIEDLLRHGFIEPSSSSWCSPVVLVRKPHSDEYRLCCDFRLTNAKCIAEAFPTISLEEIWEIIGIHRPALLTKLDLMSGFLQLAMHQDTEHKSTFVVRGYSYQWKRVPFGLRNSPIVFQKTMVEVLKGLLFKTCLIYLDDIIVWCDCLECHKKNLQEVFDRPEKANLKASKCEFAMEEITYAGHILSSAGVRPNPEKVSVVKNFPAPKNVKEIWQFLGLSQYYRRFQKHFAQISKTLYDLTRKDVKLEWTEERENVFQTLKNNLINPPILAYPDPNKPYIISTDASSNGLGYVLSQKDNNRPIYAIWHRRSWPTLVKVMAHCLTVPSHYLSLENNARSELLNECYSCHMYKAKWNNQSQCVCSPKGVPQRVTGLHKIRFITLFDLHICIHATQTRFQFVLFYQCQLRFKSAHANNLYILIGLVRQSYI